MDDEAVLSPALSSEVYEIMSNVVPHVKDSMDIIEKAKYLYNTWSSNVFFLTI